MEMKRLVFSVIVQSVQFCRENGIQNCTVIRSYGACMSEDEAHLAAANYNEANKNSSMVWKEV